MWFNTSLCIQKACVTWLNVHYGRNPFCKTCLKLCIHVALVLLAHICLWGIRLYAPMIAHLRKPKPSCIMFKPCPWQKSQQAIFNPFKLLVKFQAQIAKLGIQFEWVNDQELKLSRNDKRLLIKWGEITHKGTIKSNVDLDNSELSFYP